MADGRIFSLDHVPEIGYMQIHLNLGSIRQTTRQELITRFVLGGLITALAGVIAKKYGVSVGGLFLAFPAIFPASATLVELHEKKKKQKAGWDGTKRGRDAAALDAAGAARGSVGLLVFAILVWRFVKVVRP